MFQSFGVRSDAGFPSAILPRGQHVLGTSTRLARAVLQCRGIFGKQM